MSHISIDIESQNSQSHLHKDLEPSSGVEMVTPASQKTADRAFQAIENRPIKQLKTPCHTTFWVLLILTLILAGGLSAFSWQLNLLNAEANEIESHYIQITEQILTVNTTSCGKLFGIGFLTDNQPQAPLAVTTRTLTFNCPINQCSCDSYADQWIAKQRLNVVYYVDTNPTDFITSHPRPLDGPITGYIVGICFGSVFLLFSLILTIRSAPCNRS